MLVDIFCFIFLLFFPQILNIGDLSTWMNQEVTGDGESNDLVARCILCMPIINSQKQVIGVAQLINKVNIFL